MCNSYNYFRIKTLNCEKINLLNSPFKKQRGINKTLKHS